MSKDNSKYQISFLQCILTVIFVVALLISNIVEAKVISIFGLTLTCGVFVFPITYVLSDIFSEVYGYWWSRVTCYMAFGSNFFMVVLFQLMIAAPGVEPEISEAFSTTLGATPIIFIASALAFVVGDFVNDKVFAKLKKDHVNDHRGFNFRAILSSLVGEVVDSSVFFPIAFGISGIVEWKLVPIMAITQIILKTGYEVIILPVTNLILRAVSKYEITKTEKEANLDE